MAEREPDPVLVERLRSGDTSALAPLMDRHAARIYRVAHGITRNEADAEEVVQDVFLTLARKADSFQGRAALSSWLYAITRNRCLTALANRGAFEPLTGEDLEEPRAEPAAPADHALESGSERLRELVDQLPERLRQVLVLYYFEERSVGEVALMLGCPEGTVKTHLFRARAALARELERRGLHDPEHWMEIA